MTTLRLRTCQVGGGLWLLAAAACASGAAPAVGAGGHPSAGAAAGGGSLLGGGGSGGGAAECGCVPGPHVDHIFVLSDHAVLWMFDPATSQFDEVGPVSCGGSSQAFSMAVDPLGRAWVLLADTHDLFTIDPKSPATCGDPGYAPDQDGFGLFGMAFSKAGGAGACAKLYAHSYSGKGPFREGPGIGQLGVMDPASAQLHVLAPIDYDGGELSGTGDGRLFAFAGAHSAKLVQYDEATGAVVATTPLAIETTNASAFAFYGGDFYFFTEAPPAGCDACLSQTCEAARAACEADPACAAQLACAIAAGDVSDVCGGGIPQDLQNCLASCASECFPPPETKVSRVTRMDYDGSDGPGQALTVAVDAAPIRIVGAGTSPCVPVVPR